MRNAMAMQADRRSGFPLRAALRLLCVLAACTGLPSRVAATELVVGVYDNPPKVHVDADGRPAGLFVELLDEIARREGWSLRYRVCDWEDCLQQLERGDIDLMPDVAYTIGRRQKFDFHRIAVTHSWSTFVVAQDSPIHALPDLAGARIAILRGAVQ